MLGCPQTRKNSYIKIKDIIKIPTTFSLKSLLNFFTNIIKKCTQFAGIVSCIEDVKTACIL